MPKVKDVVVLLVVAEVDEVSSSIRSGVLIMETTRAQEMESSIAETRGCATVSIRAVAGTQLTLWVFTLHGSVIRALSVCQATMITGSCLVRHALLMVPRKVEPLVGLQTKPLKVKQADLPVRGLLFRRLSVVINQRRPTQGSPLSSPILLK